MTGKRTGRLTKRLAIVLSVMMLSCALPVAVPAVESDVPQQEVSMEANTVGQDSSGSDLPGSELSGSEFSETGLSESSSSENENEEGAVAEEAAQSDIPDDSSAQDDACQDSQDPASAQDDSQISDGNDLQVRDDCDELENDGEEDNIVFFTLMLDANGGYFANEWDDILNDSVERTDTINRVIPSGETVNNITPIMEQENATVTFLGWSLERDGEVVGVEYAPVEDCTLYAVWQVEEAVIEAAPEEDESSEGTEWQEETAGDTIDDEESMSETDVAQDEDTVPETGAAQDTDDIVRGTDAVEDDAAQENHETVEEAVAAQEPGNTEAAEEPEADSAPAKTKKAESGTSDQQNSTSGQENTPAQTVLEDAEEETIGEDAAMSIIESGTCGNNVTWTLDDAGTLTISGTGDMWYYHDTSYCKFNKYPIKKVIIENGVTSIGGAEFHGCSSLSSVTIPNSVTSIGWAAFGSCNSLKNVTIPNSVTSIGNGAFRLCTSLESVTIPNSVTSLGQYVFLKCTNLSNVTIPDSLTRIEYADFMDCTSLRNVTIPESVTYIGDNAFRNCTSLRGVTIPESVTYLGRYSFDGTKNVSYTVANGVEILQVGFVLSGVENLYIPKSVKYIGESEITGNYNTEINGSDEITGKNIYFAGNINEWKRIKCTVDWGFDERNVWHATQEYFYTRVPSGTLHVGELLGNSITAKNITVNALNKQQTKNINTTATAGTVKYSSNNSNITVNSAGKLTIKANYVGKATITMTASAQYYKTAKKTITVTVKKATPTITASNKTRTASAKKQTFKLGAKTTGGKLSYKSDTKGISVNSNGTVTVSAKFVGKGTITITSAPSNAFYKATKKITVTVKKQAPTITAKNMTQYVAKNIKTYDLGATCSISGALKYKSNNSNITVNSAGKITVKKNYEGKATITISLPANAIRKAASKTVTVSIVKRNNPITASNITTYYASGKKILDIGASCKGRTKLTYSSDNSHIKVSSAGDITISAGYVGKATITIKTSGNRYYKASSKKITVTVKDSGSGSGGSSGGGGSASTVRECQQCSGTGVCPICGGKGLNTSGSPDNWTKCVSCKGDGYCHYCGGDGIKDN